MNRNGAEVQRLYLAADAVPTHPNSTLSLFRLGMTYSGSSQTTGCLDFGASADDYPVPYFTVAVALGVAPEELDDFLGRLDKTFLHFHKQIGKGMQTARQDAAAPTCA